MTTIRLLSAASIAIAMLSTPAAAHENSIAGRHVVLKGNANAKLLESYDAERQPIGRQIVARANKSQMQNYKVWDLLGGGTVTQSAPDSHKAVFDTKEERALLRRQALDWLRQDLSWCGERIDDGNAQTNAWIRQRLQLWWRDPALEGVRADDALARLPDEERERWERLWSDVAALLGRGSVPK